MPIRVTAGVVAAEVRFNDDPVTIPARRVTPKTPCEEPSVDSNDRIKITKLYALIRDVPDFPKPGIMFKDITPLLGDAAGLSLAVEYLTQPFRRAHVDIVVGAESRGFIFGTAVARNLSAGFVPIRKPGRLPGKTHSESYELEYGTDRMEVHENAIHPGDRVLLIDDLLATGGTMAACCRLVAGLGGHIVGIAVLIELAFLHGRAPLADYPVHSILTYDREATAGDRGSAERGSANPGGTIP